MSQIHDSIWPIGGSGIDPRLGRRAALNRWGEAVEPQPAFWQQTPRSDVGRVMRQGWRRILRLSGLAGQ